ncbi:MAG: c-type cytochrome, partial [Deltaproteobacteria bacterium]|nr:c-type cytochrome [Deltaproteobacteria bacterium]
ALVIDADSGTLVRVGPDLAPTARLALGPGASQLVYDPALARAYVADRANDRIVVVDVGARALTVRARWATPAEPFGVALTPDHQQLLVTTIADRAMVALATADGAEQWRHALAAEPRGVAIAASGREAMVGYLTTGTVERIALDRAGHPGHHIALGTGAAAIGGDPSLPSFARNAFAVRYLGDDLALAAHQISTPVQAIAGSENRGSYGGGFTPPITHRLAFLGPDEGGATAQVGAAIMVHQPQAIAWDSLRDLAYVAGYGSDDLLIVGHASQSSAAMLATGRVVAPEASCGPQGLAVAPDGALLVWCGISRTIVRVSTEPPSTGARTSVAIAAPATDAAAITLVGASRALTTSRLSAIAHRGLELFRLPDARLSSRGALACASCHPEGRDDALSWRIDGHTLQTPLLAGRIVGTHPYKWDGGDPDLAQSLTSTMRRLGGTGLDAPDVKALSAYLEAQAPPRRPTVAAAAVARGKRLFTGELGCNTCHDGAAHTDRARHDLGSDMKQVDTPSLVGVAASAPYYHDGSAATLPALLRDTASVHGMAETAQLTDSQIADVVAYLQTL